MGRWKDGHRVITRGKPQDGLQLSCVPPNPQPVPKTLLAPLLSAILRPFPRNKDVHPESGEEPRTRRQVSHPNSATMWHWTGQVPVWHLFPHPHHELWA